MEYFNTLNLSQDRRENQFKKYVIDGEDLKEMKKELKKKIKRVSVASLNNEQPSQSAL